MNNHLGIDQLAQEFFKEFSRSEYSLKAAGFNHGDGNAEANWSMFSKEVKGLVQDRKSEQLSYAINFILNYPPKKQIIRDGRIQWSEAAQNNKLKAENLLVYVRRVRNNLFHGGKFNGHWFEPERSKKLIVSCLVILKAFVNYVEKTREAYQY